MSDAYKHFMKLFLTYVFFFFIVISSNLRCVSVVTRKIHDECIYASNEITKSLMMEMTNNYEDQAMLGCA